MNATALDGQAQMRGKCQYWRERMYEDDRWDSSVKGGEKRVCCSCFIEGTFWESSVAALPDDCPSRYTCRYHIQAW